MGTYQKGQTTKESILQTARQLFYEKGYRDTFCKDIAREAGVNVGLIHYYYKTKGNIAWEIYASFLSEMLDRISVWFPQEDDLVQKAITIRLLWNLLGTDEKLKRFFHEIIAERIPLQLGHSEEGSSYTKALNQSLQWENPELVQIICQCSTAVEMELIEHYVSGECTLSLQELAELDERYTLQMSFVPEKEILRVLERSAECAAVLQMQCDAQFHILLTEK